VRELRPEIPAGIEAVVMRSLARNPEYRPPSAAALGQELAGAATEDVTHPLPQASGVRASEVRTEPLRPPVRPDRKGQAFDRRIVIGALVVLLVIAAIVIGVAGRSGGDDKGSSGKPAPARVEPLQETGDPSTDAQNLADWLRANAG
jgi:hypothetical protein